MLWSILMKKDSFGTGINDLVDMFVFNYSFTINNDFVTFDRHHFTGIFIHEVFDPGFKHTGGKFTTNHFFKSGFGHFQLRRQDRKSPEYLYRFHNRWL